MCMCLLNVCISCCRLLGKIRSILKISSLNQLSNWVLCAVLGTWRDARLRQACHNCCKHAMMWVGMCERTFFFNKENLKQHMARLRGNYLHSWWYLYSWQWLYVVRCVIHSNTMCNGRSSWSIVSTDHMIVFNKWGHSVVISSPFLKQSYWTTLVERVTISCVVRDGLVIFRFPSACWWETHNLVGNRILDGQWRHNHLSLRVNQWNDHSYMVYRNERQNPRSKMRRYNWFDIVLMQTCGAICISTQS